MSASTLEQVPTDDLLAMLKRRCSALSSTHKRVVLLGPPGCGKGTQSEWLKNDLGLVHVSTGELLRAAVRNRTAVGIEAERIMKAGGLVPDEIVLDIVRQRLEELQKDPSFRGYILDGFPRTVRQAEGLDRLLQEAGVELNGVFTFVVDEETLKQRLCGRRIHPASGRTYHIVTKPPKVAGKDDITGEDLIQRQDDKEHCFDHRMKVYREQTAPLIDYYQKTGKLFRIDAGQSPEDVRHDLELLFAVGDSQSHLFRAAKDRSPDLVTTASA